jgi:PIN domain nuclease of toxin-antitoxin system
LPEIPEMHDRLIALAAKRLGATIITKDKTIQASPHVKCHW